MKLRAALPAAAWGLLGPAIAILLVLARPDFITRLELQTQDVRTRMAGPATHDPRVALVIVDDQSLARFGRWPWPRSRHAPLISRIKALGAKAIVYDFIFGQPSADPSQDQAITKAMRDSRIMVLTMPISLDPIPAGMKAPEPDPSSWNLMKRFLTKVSGEGEIAIPEGTRIQPPPESFLSSASVLATNPATPDPDGVFRRMPLLLKYKGEVVPALGLAALKEYGAWDFENMRLDGRYLVVPALAGKGERDIRVPLDRHANMIVDWIGPWSAWDTPTTTYCFSAQWFLDPNPPRDVLEEMEKRIKGAIVFVGASYTGGSDIRPQPFQTAYPMVGMHANIANTILSGRFRTESGRAAAVAYILLLSAAAVALGFIRRPWLGPLFGVLVLAGYAGYSMAALEYMSNYVPLALPALAFVSSSAAITVYRVGKQSRELRYLRDQFGPVLPPAVFEKLLKDPDAVKFTGERRELSVLFSDIKGFTTISDREQPEVIYEILTEYFEAMTAIIFENNGTIDKFIGDGIMAFWGAPLSSDSHALDAVRAAVQMQRTTRKLSDSWEKKGWPPIRIRIGVNTGQASVGFFGSPLYREYTALGSSVNMAQRLESNCTPGNVMISTRTAELVKDEFKSDPVGPIQLKGFSEPVRVCEIECSD